MKTTLFLLMMSLSLATCRSQDKMMEREGMKLYTRPVDVTITETSNDTLTVVNESHSVKQEKVTLVEGASLMRYCVIVGSFKYEQNAVKLKNQLQRDGFGNTSVMQNSEGMYRVSILCDEALPDALEDLKIIRERFPQYRDAWLLRV
ncbi:MAG: SPOR domain-containing protein [Odoribacter sp.]